MIFRKLPVREINLDHLLAQLGLTQSQVLYGNMYTQMQCPVSIIFQQFIDLCILLGCDYCDSVKGLCRNYIEFVHTRLLV